MIAFFELRQKVYIRVYAHTDITKIYKSKIAGQLLLWVWINKTKWVNEWCERFLRGLKEDWLALSKMIWRIFQIFVHRLKKSIFNLENEKAELNQNQNSKQPDLPDVVWKFYFTFEINE